MSALIPSLAFFMFLSAAFRGSRTPAHGARGDVFGSEGPRSDLDAATITRLHAYLIYDTLFAMDERREIKPRCSSATRSVETGYAQLEPCAGTLRASSTPSSSKLLLVRFRFARDRSLATFRSDKWYSLIAARSNIAGFLITPTIVFWNIEKAEGLVRGKVACLSDPR
jgi:hypothetical protein